MRLRLGRPRTAMVFAPHPDDEIIGAAGLIATLVGQGCRVTVVIVSDGAASHPASRQWPRARLVAERRRESRRALGRLGLPAGSLIFLDLPDGSLRPGDRCRRGVARVVARQRRLDLIVAPAADDAHPDHRAVAAAVRSSSGGSRRLGYRIWPPRAVRRAGLRSLPLSGTSARKRSLIRSYRTQLGLIRDDPRGFAIARHELDAFSRPIEHFLESTR